MWDRPIDQTRNVQYVESCTMHRALFSGNFFFLFWRQHLCMWRKLKKGKRKKEKKEKNDYEWKGNQKNWFILWIDFHVRVTRLKYTAALPGGNWFSILRFIQTSMHVPSRLKLTGPLNENLPAPKMEMKLGLQKKCPSEQHLVAGDLQATPYFFLFLSSWF